MVGGEITPVVGIKRRRNAADMPPWDGLAPDRLAQHQRRLDRRGRMKTHPKPCHGSAIVIHNDGQPGTSRRPTVLLHPEIQERVVSLPDPIWSFRFTAIEQIKGHPI